MKIKTIITSIMFVLAITANAQTWIKTTTKGDELLGTKDHITYKSGKLTIRENETNTQEHLIMFSSRELFDNDQCNLIIGCYSNDSVLVEKYEIIADCGIASYVGWVNTISNPSFKKVLDFIFNKEGYIRLHYWFEDYTLPTFVSSSPITFEEWKKQNK